MKIVNYSTTQYLNCSCTPSAPAIICLPSTLVASGKPTIDVTIVSVAQTSNACGVQIYTYTLQYDGTLLTDSSYTLRNSDISGIICRDCLTAYIDANSGGGGGGGGGTGLPVQIAVVATEADLLSAEAGAATEMLVVSSFSLTAARTVTKGMTIIRGAAITPGVFTLTINGPFRAGAYRTFITTSSGLVTFANNSVESINPAWFYALASDAGLAINIARSANNSIPVVLPAGIFPVHTRIYASFAAEGGQFLLRGAGSAVGQNPFNVSTSGYSGTVLNGSGLADYVITIDGQGSHFYMLDIADFTVVAGTRSAIKIDLAAPANIKNVTAVGAPTNYYGMELTSFYGSGVIDNITASYNTGAGFYFSALNSAHLGTVVANNNTDAAHPYAIVINGGLQITIENIVAQNNQYGALRIDGGYETVIQAIYTESNNYSNAGVYEVLLGGNATYCNRVTINDWFVSGPHNAQYFSGATLGVKNVIGLVLGGRDNTSNVPAHDMVKTLVPTSASGAITFCNFDSGNGINIVSDTGQRPWQVSLLNSTIDTTKFSINTSGSTYDLGSNGAQNVDWGKVHDAYTNIASYSVPTDKTVIYADASANDVIVKLPVTGFSYGKLYTVVKNDAAGLHAVTVTTEVGGESIMSGNLVMSTAWDRASFRCYNAHWYRVS